MNIIDRMVAAVSPERGAKRMAARYRLNLYQNRMAYDGASVSRRTSGWRRVSTDANAETNGGSLIRLRDVARDLHRNNPTARRGIEVLVNNVVGGGVMPHFTGASDRATGDLEAKAIAHFDSTAIDAAGHHNLYGLQRLVFSTIALSGECLIRRRRRTASDGLPLPFQIQVLEPDYLDSMKDGATESGGVIVQGVEFDAMGRYVACWLFDEHPGSARRWRSMQSRQVPAEDVIRVYRKDRPGQVRGVPWLAPIMLRLHDFADYEDAQLLRQKIAASFSVFLTDPEGRSADEQPAINRDRTQSGFTIEEIEPGMIETLPPGYDVEFASPPGVDGYADYARISDRKFAAGLGVPYESLTGDYSQVNFSSGRMGWLEFHRTVDVHQSDIVIQQFCKPIERWFLQACSMSGIDTRDVRSKWTAPRREMIDPTKEVPSNRDAIRSGQTTLSEVIRKTGRDPAEFYAELKADFDLLDELDIILDCDPRQVSRAGLTQARTPGTALPDTEPAENEDGQND